MKHKHTKAFAVVAIVAILAPQAMAQDGPAVETVTTTIEQTIVRYGSTVLEKTSRVISETVIQSPSTAVEMEGEVTATLVSPTLEVSTVQAVEPGKFLIRATPGEYLIFPGTVQARKVIVERQGPDIAGLSSLADTLATALNDQPTREAIADALSETVSLGEMYTVESARAEVQDAIKGVLLQRQGASRYVDWLNGFRRPIDDAIAKAGIETPNDYFEAVLAVVQGLRVSPASEVDVVPKVREVVTGCRRGQCVKPEYWVE